jgi:hypothetical protein
MTTTPADALAARPMARTRRVFVPLSLLAALIALVGFWPTYFGPLLLGGKAATVLVHVHAGVFVGWLAMFGMQAALAANGRIALHTRLGPWLFAFGVPLIMIGVATALARFDDDLAASGLAVAARRVFGPLRDMVFFAPFLAAGWIYRRRPEIHKRCMLVATTILLVAAVGRMSFLGTPPSEAWFFSVWPLPVYIAMLHDYVTKRLIHPVHVLGLLAMLGMRLVLPLRTTQPWLDFAAWLATFYR